MSARTRRGSREAGDATDRDLDDQLSELYRAERALMVRFAAAALGETEAAQDAVNEAFAKALLRASSLREAASLRAWVWAILVNETKSRRRVRHRTVTLGDAVDEVAASPSPHVDDDIRRQLRRLPKRQRTILFLRHYGDLSNVEIGHVLGISPGTVGATLHQGHQNLRRILEEQ